MECNQARQVQAYHDSRLSPAARAAVEAHLRDCGWCAQLLERLRSLSTALASAPMSTMPDAALQRLRGAFDVIRAASLGERMALERAARERGVLRIAGWLTAAAAALLMAGLVMLAPANSRTGVAERSTGASDLTAAVMPPGEMHEGTPQLVQVAQWIADDLSISVENPGSPAAPGGEGP